MWSAVQKVTRLLTPRERRRGAIVLIMMLLQAVVDTVGIASVMPFLAVLGNPEMVATNRSLAWLYDRGHFASVEKFLFALGLVAFLIIISGALLRMVTTYATNRFTQMRQYTIAARLLDAYLRQPYTFFLNRNSADLSKSLLAEVAVVVTKVLQPMLAIIAHGLTLLIVAGFLVVVDPIVAIVVAGGLAGAYGLIYACVHPVLRRIGEERLNANRERYTAASEAFGGIKDLKVLGRERAYLARFQQPAQRYAKHYATSATLSTVPKFLIEGVGFGGVLVLALALMSTRQDLGAVLPLLGLYAFAGYRLLPAAQNVYAGVSTVRFALPAVDTVYEDLILRQPHVETPQPKTASFAPLVDSIRFEGVWFTYPGAERSALTNLDLTIRAGTAVAFVGQTGAGKTTAVDLILGLLQPTTGQLVIDGKPLTTSKLRDWQRRIGYVPQTIYLADASVTENIAFGVEHGTIDHAAVERAARIAKIHDYIKDELPQGYATRVGERGVRLSGGQRQRIGIARALYHDPSVLVFDEATSALDRPTEQAIMEAVQLLRGDKTIIMIAHRVSTIRHCDQIIMLHEGAVTGEGSFDELSASNPLFAAFGVA